LTTTARAVLDKVAEQRNWTDLELNEEFDRRRDVIKWMVDNGIKNYVDVGEILAAYYKDPDRVMKRVRSDEQSEETLIAPAEVDKMVEKEGPAVVPLTEEAEKLPEHLDVEEIPATRHRSEDDEEHEHEQQVPKLEERKAELDESEVEDSHAAE